jgi:guanylate kinase
MNSRKKNLLIVISGPSGVGKGTVVSELLKASRNIKHSISFTTRPPRLSEIDGYHYFFVTHEKFHEKIKNGEFLEWAEVHGHYYGTSWEPVEEMLKNGYDVVIEVDIQGAASIKSAFARMNYSNAKCFLIFLIPPSFEALSKRLEKRQTETPEITDMRLLRAAVEFQAMRYFDYVVLNKDLEKAVAEIKNIIKNERKN